MFCGRYWGWEGATVLSAYGRCLATCGPANKIQIVKTWLHMLICKDSNGVWGFTGGCRYQGGNLGVLTLSTMTLWRWGTGTTGHPPTTLVSPPSTSANNRLITAVGFVFDPDINNRWHPRNLSLPFFQHIYLRARYHDFKLFASAYLLLTRQDTRNARINTAGTSSSDLNPRQSPAVIKLSRIDGIYISEGSIYLNNSNICTIH